MFSGERESVNAEHHHACRPLCHCCGGGDWRKGYTRRKFWSRLKSVKARKPRQKYKIKEM